MYRHIVLLVRERASGQWGALGLSRKPDLMFKPLGYPSASSVLADFKSAYEAIWHDVRLIFVGLPVPHDETSVVPVCWRYAVARMDRPWAGACVAIDSHCGKLERLWERWRDTGRAPITGLEDRAGPAGKGGRGAAPRGEGEEPEEEPGGAAAAAKQLEKLALGRGGAGPPPDADFDFRV